MVRISDVSFGSKRSVQGGKGGAERLSWSEVKRGKSSFLPYQVLGFFKPNPNPKPKPIEALSVKIEFASLGVINDQHSKSSGDVKSGRLKWSKVKRGISSLPPDQVFNAFFKPKPNKISKSNKYQFFKLKDRGKKDEASS